jgi:uncharacterized protein YbaR (Trm112 family)
MKKIICPKCKEKLDDVVEDRVQRAFYNVDINYKALALENYSLNDYDDIMESKFYCKNCDKLIAKDELAMEKLICKAMGKKWKQGKIIKF